MNIARTARLIATGVLFSVTAFAAEPPPLQLLVHETGIAVTNATPGGSVVLFATGIEGSFGVLRQRRLARTVTADGAGAFEYRPDRALPYRTIYAAVDVETGRTALGGAPEYEIQVRPFPTEKLKHESDGVSGLAGAELPRAELLVVRPKGGAWMLVASEGDSGDDDKQHDGRLALDFSAAISIGPDTPAPKRLKSKDVVILIDSARLEVFITEIAQGRAASHVHHQKNDADGTKVDPGNKPPLDVFRYEVKRTSAYGVIDSMHSKPHGGNDWKVKRLWPFRFRIPD